MAARRVNSWTEPSRLSPAHSPTAWVRTPGSSPGKGRREQVDGGPVLGQIGDRLTDVPADEAVGILVAEGREDGLLPGTVVLVLGRGARGGEEVVGRGV